MSEGKSSAKASRSLLLLASQLTYLQDRDAAALSKLRGGPSFVSSLSTITTFRALLSAIQLVRAGSKSRQNQDALMTTPDIPPELVESILQQLPSQDDETIPTLLACTLVSRTFSAISKLDSIWSEIAQERGGLFCYVRLSDQQDQCDMDLAFPLERRDTPTVYERLIAGKHLKHIFDRHMDCLLSEPSHKISHVLALVDLGRGNLSTFSRLADLDKDGPNSLARYYWLKEAREAVARRDAVEIWRDIGRGYERFSDAIFAFSAFSGPTGDSLIYLGVIGAARAYEEIYDYLEKKPLPSPAAPSMITAAQQLLIRFFGVPAAPSQAIVRTPRSTMPTSFSKYWASRVACDLLETIVQGDSKDSLPSEPDSEEHPRGDVSSADEDDEDVYDGHGMVMAALLCAILTRQAAISITARPVQLYNTTLVLLERRGIAEQQYLALVPPVPIRKSDLRELYKFSPPAFKQGITETRFGAPTLARDMINAFACELDAALLDTYDNRLEADHVGCARYATALARLLVPPSKRKISYQQLRLASDEELARLAVEVVSKRYPWDSALVRQVLQGIKSISPAMQRHIETLRDIERSDQESAAPKSRTGLAHRLRFRVGDVVKVRRAGGEEIGVVIGWGLDYSAPSSILKSLSIRKDKKASPAQLQELDRQIELPRSVRVAVSYDVFCSDGSIRTVQDGHELARSLLGNEERTSLLLQNDIGRWFKHIEEDKTRFVIADDHRKRYPDD